MCSCNNSKYEGFNGTWCTYIHTLKYITILYIYNNLQACSSIQLNVSLNKFTISKAKTNATLTSSKAWFNKGKTDTK